ncbi:transcription-repair-coupling factor [Allostella vacuolata]|nr:transcription-repair-coupling factor [Stella vacuolata]
MIRRRDLFATPGRVVLSGVPEGYDALVLARLAAEAGPPILHVARDEPRMMAMVEAARFLAPGLEILPFPAWDCLPYDRASPNVRAVSRRIETLVRLGQPADGRRLVVTTVNALLQRVPPRSFFQGAMLNAAVGGDLPDGQVTAFLARNGYRRVGTVREAGEYALRGGILDLFPPGAELPIRIDRFGDQIEAMRAFDPLTQRSTGDIPSMSLMPVSEIRLDEETVERFRTGYRERFGAISDDDLLYAAISEARPYAGMEHWLPLFHERLETLFDHLPEACPVVFDHQAEEAVTARFATIRDYYDTRRSMMNAATGGAPYRPLPPAMLYLAEDEWDETLVDRAVVHTTPFNAPGSPGRTIDAGGRRGREFGDVRAAGANVYEALRDHLQAEQAAGRRTIVAAYSTGSRERLRTVLAEHGITAAETVERWQKATSLAPGRTALLVLPIEQGFVDDKLSVVTEQDVLGDRLARTTRRRRNFDQFVAEVSALTIGDFVVHADHGIGRYDGLVTLDVAGAAHDCLRVVYDGGDKLFVPVENIEILSRYGSGDGEVALDKLGGAGWQSRKARVKQRIRAIADELVRLAATREVRSGEVMPPPEGLFDEFCARFPFPETEDQLRAIADVVEDLGSGRPMDRLVCGDVGFGKTEVALRAAFIAALGGSQVAVIVPTTLLARQHHRTFVQRFAGLPVRIEQLSRLVTPKNAKAVKAMLAEGQVDIIVGTHAVLAKDVKFRHLGLVIVDEEQHFGVAQKEKLKHLRAEVHILTLTATPIPRTLQMALSGVRQMSIIATPPVDRLAVRTFVLPFDPVVVREAILRERYRSGQVFYVCPRIEDLTAIHEQLRELVPEAKVAVAHGRMAPAEIETVMSEFCDGAYDILLSTTIIESGLDIPSANTMIVHRADMFGLAQLYQLRGRIGRGKQRAYAYLTLPPGKMLTETAQRRLEVMQTLDTLGAGFTLASHDLDIRGAGNLLGEEQSGHVREVGVELYQQLLEEAVAEARGLAEEEAGESWTPQIAIGTSVLIPEGYVADLGVRLGLYRRISTLVDRREIDAFAAELGDRFGPLPAEVENLLDVIAIKQLCREARIERIEAGPKGCVIGFHGNSFPNPAGLVEFIARNAGTARVRPDHKLVITRTWDEAKQRLLGLQNLLKTLVKLARGEAMPKAPPPKTLPPPKALAAKPQPQPPKPAPRRPLPAKFTIGRR